jgi:hypothetical protein
LLMLRKPSLAIKQVAAGLLAAVSRDGLASPHQMLAPLSRNGAAPATDLTDQEVVI